MADKFQKIVLLGLENAGKTSIVFTLRREFDALSQVKPTKGIERDEFEIFGQEVYFWDYGGQKRYRSHYLEDKEKYLSNINILYYVVDVQDRGRIEEARTYFIQLFKKISGENQDLTVSFIFHKWDPKKILKDKKIHTRTHEVEEFEHNKNLFLDSVFSEITLNKPANLFETSIFDPLSIIRAISKPLFEKQDLHKRTSEILAQYCKKYNFQFGFVNLTNSFELGGYIDEDVVIIPKLNFDLNMYLEKNKRNLIESPFLHKVLDNYHFLSSRFLLREHGLFFIILLTVGYDKSLARTEFNGTTQKAQKKAILEGVSELKKLYRTIGLDNYQII